MKQSKNCGVKGLTKRGMVVAKKSATEKSHKNWYDRYLSAEFLERRM